MHFDLFVVSWIYLFVCEVGVLMGGFYLILGFDVFWCVCLLEWLPGLLWVWPSWVT